MRLVFGLLSSLLSGHLLLQLALGLVVGFLVMKLLAWVGWLLLIITLLLWALVLACWWHARHPPRAGARRSWMRDILDRLTRVEVLKEALQAAPSAGPSLIEIDAPSLAAKVKESVFGQDAVCDDVALEIKQQAQRVKRTDPLGVFLFVGPPATGKTHFAKTLAAALPAEFAVTFIEMAQHSEAHTASALFGQAKGYAGSDSYGTITRDLRANPRRVVILDEFEKAHREVQEKFLSAWNDGFVTEVSTGEKIPTVNAIFIATSNAAQQTIAETVKGLTDRDAISDACKNALRGTFSPPVLSRFYRFFVFLPLGDEDLARLIASQIERDVAAYELEIADQGIDVHILIDLIRQTRRQDADAREVGRMVRRTIGSRIAEFKEKNPKVRRIQLKRDASGVTVRSGDEPAGKRGG